MAWQKFPRGVVQGIDPMEAIKELFENIDANYHEIIIILARPLDNEGTYLLILKAETQTVTETETHLGTKFFQ